MSVRRNAITGDPVVFAPERAERPGAFTGAAESDDRCPFCPGNERDTPPSIAATGDPWRVRIFPNKYPPMDGAEVIVESPRHGDTFDGIEHAEEVVRAYLERYEAHHAAAYTSVFKNQGVRSGSSIAHVHSQVMPLPFVPPRVQREAAAFERASACPLCALEEAEVIRETTLFRWVAPHASSMPWQQWIVPVRHVADVTELLPAEIGALAEMLRAASAAMLRIADSYNWILMNFPPRHNAHFYVDLFPRVTTLAGFELGTGTFVEIIDPAAAARRLRERLSE